MHGCKASKPSVSDFLDHEDGSSKVLRNFRLIFHTTHHHISKTVIIILTGVREKQAQCCFVDYKLCVTDLLGFVTSGLDQLDRTADRGRGPCRQRGIATCRGNPADPVGLGARFSLRRQHPAHYNDDSNCRQPEPRT